MGTRKQANSLPLDPAVPSALNTRQAGPAPADVTADLLVWYDRHRRALPWRALPGARTPAYAVWLSEIMLQQTTVAAVKPYFAKFLSLWPDVDQLAAASQDEVMRAWAGLGYYSRARNLHACAQTVVRDFGGRFPREEGELRSLPGIGAYTAAAIASIAFGCKATVVDGNVERVMSRLYAIAEPMPKGKTAVALAMGAATPEDRPGDFAQAVMDLGATICTPKSPACVLCPLTRDCVARANGTQTLFPVKVAKRANPIRYGTAYYVTNGRGDVLVQTRPPVGLLGGMTELPGTAWGDEPASISDADRGAEREGMRVKHVFTHFTLMLDVVTRVSPNGALPDTVVANETRRWVAVTHLMDEALPTLMRHAIALAQSGR
nr:A/G-specific adenine glycosylase [Lichenihabitans psoromatis]